MHYVFLSFGGWEQNASYVRLREFGIELLKRGHSVTYFVDEDGWNRTSLKLPAGSKTVFVPAGSVRKAGAFRKKEIAKLHPDFVHFINPSAGAFASLFGTKHKMVGDWDEWPAMRPHPWKVKLKEKFLDRWLRKRADFTVVASRYLQREFEELGVTSAYIPYATYMQSFDDGDSPFCADRAAVYMGNLFPLYDHDLLFEAAVLLKERGFSPRLEILGHGDDLEKWRSFVADRGLSNVHVRGFVRGEQLFRNLRHAHVLLFPIRETLTNLCRCPSKTFSYAQVGRPIIANRVGEVAEVLGDKATYVDATPQAFADAISAALEQAPREVDYHAELHSWSDRTDKLLDWIGVEARNLKPLKSSLE